MDRPAENLYASDMTQGAQILTYNLFGESTDLPDVVHCETIETRSRLHDWEFAPHRHARLHQALFVETGGGQASLDGMTLDLPTGRKLAETPEMLAEFELRKAEIDAIRSAQGAQLLASTTEANPPSP